MKSPTDQAVVSVSLPGVSLVRHTPGKHTLEMTVTHVPPLGRVTLKPLGRNDSGRTPGGSVTRRWGTHWARSVTRGRVTHLKRGPNRGRAEILAGTFQEGRGAPGGDPHPPAGSRTTTTTPVFNALKSDSRVVPHRATGTTSTTVESFDSRGLFLEGRGAQGATPTYPPCHSGKARTLTHPARHHHPQRQGGLRKSLAVATHSQSPPTPVVSVRYLTKNPRLAGFSGVCEFCSGAKFFLGASGA